MARNCLRINHEGDSIQLSWQRGQANPRPAPSVTFTHPFGEQARQFFQAATYEGLNQCELVITSDSPEVLNLPWELLYSPSDRQFLAPSLAGMSRSLSEYAVRAEMSDLPQDKLNMRAGNCSSLWRKRYCSENDSPSVAGSFIKYSP